MTSTCPILVAGRSGRLARSLAEAAAARGMPLRALGRPDLDIEDSRSIADAMTATAPIAVINAAGHVMADEAERAPNRAFAINRDGAARLAAAAACAGVPYVHLSTDYVFDGAQRTPYRETDVAQPLSVYGQSKAAGEQAVLTAHPAAVVVRTSWVFGRQGPNFVTTMLRCAATQDSVQVVTDQYGAPTEANALAHALLDLTGQLLQTPGTERGGIYHIAGIGGTTWFNLAEATFAGWARRGHRVPRLEPIGSAQWRGLARRPPYSLLDCGKAERVFGIRLPPWQESLESCLDALHHESRA
jgi:dTDP-4-dehydrorhamnose reductase